MVWLSGVWEKLTVIPVSYTTEESESIHSISRIFHIGPQHPELISETPARRRSSEEKCVPTHPKTWDSWGQGHTLGDKGAPMPCLSLCISVCPLPLKASLLGKEALRL